MRVEPHDEIIALRRRGRPERCLALFLPCEDRIRRQSATLGRVLTRTNYAGILISDFQASEQ